MSTALTFDSAPHGGLADLRLLGEDQAIAWDAAADTVPTQIQLVADRFPFRPAIVDEQGTVSYRELDARSAQIAAWIVNQLGSADSKRVLVICPQGRWSILAVLAVLRSGHVLLFLDPSDADSRICHVMHDAEPSLILTVRSCSQQFSALTDELPVLAVDAQPERQIVSLPTLRPEQIAYVMYTSGSTGQPKGAVHTHASLLADMRCKMRFHRLQPTDRCTVLGSGTGQALKNALLPLVGGAAAVPLDVRSGGFPQAGRWLERQQVSVLTISVPLFRSIAPSLAEAQLGGVRLVRLASDSMQPTDFEIYQSCFGPHCVLLNVLSSTETGSICGRVYTHQAKSDICVGFPFDDITVSIDNDSCEGGRLVIKGPSLFCGYWRQDEKTREALTIADDGRRTYRSGDLGRIREDGAVELLGRRDQQVKVRGFLVCVPEVEAAMASHSSVAQAAVRAHHADGSTRLIGYYLPVGEGPRPGELRDFLSQRLADHMVPSRLLALAEFPLLGSGKVNRAALPAPSRERPPMACPYVAPRTPAEQRLAALFAEILAIDEIGIDDSFVALGGESMLAIRFTTRCRLMCGVQLSPPQVLRGTVRALAALVTAHESVTPEPVREEHTSYRPSPAQESLWFLHQIAAGSVAYHMPKTLALQGSLNAESLRQAMALVVERHEILRTTYRQTDDGLRAFVQAPALAWRTIDLSAVANHADHVAAALENETRKPFSLSDGPILRSLLIRLGPDRHILHCVTHHIATDHQSREILFGELFAAYDAIERNRPPDLPCLALQFGDVAPWLRQQSETALKDELCWWQKTLAGAPSTSRFPPDFARDKPGDDQGGSFSVSWDGTRGEAIRTFCRQQSMTPFAFFVAALHAVLFRYTNQRDLVLGSSMTNRGLPQTEASIGYFVDMLPLRSRLSPEHSFEAHAKAVAEAILDAYQHAVPLSQLVAALGPEREPGKQPLFQLACEVRSSAAFSRQLPGLSVQPYDVPRCASAFDLCWNFELSSGPIGVRVDYRHAQYRLETVHRLVRALEVFIVAALADPSQAISQLPILPGPVREKLCEDWIQQPQVIPEESIYALFAAQVARSPDGIALCFGNEQTTYSELAARAGKVAEQLFDAGVVNGARVAVFVPRCPDMIATLLAVLRIGAAYVPIDTSYPAGRVEFLLRDADPGAICTVASHAASLPAATAPVILVDEVRASSPTTKCWPTVSSSQTAYLMYTSGSTGQPKAAIVRHRSIVNLAWSAVVPRGSDEVFLQVAPLGFDASTFEIWGALLHGSTLVLPPPGLLSFTVLEALIRAHCVTTAFFTTSYLRSALAERPGALKGMRQVVTGGEAVSVQDARQMRQALGNEVVLLNGYGPSECTTFSTTFTIPIDTTGLDAVPIGTPLANTQVFVLDAFQQLVDVGVQGELYIAGEGVADGYWKRPAQTRSVFLDHPFHPGKTLYRSGDRCSWRDDGVLLFHGRADEQVKHRGVRIELAEVEHAIQAHHSDGEVAVVLSEGDDPELVAYVTHCGQSEIAQVRHQIAADLPSYMIPRHVVSLEALPRTANGKVDRRSLAKRSFIPAPLAAVEPANNALEQTLARICCAELGLPVFGRHDNFFEAGAHSLAALRILHRFERETGRRVLISNLLQAPTIATLLSDQDQVIETPVWWIGDRTPVAELQQAIGGHAVHWHPGEAHGWQRHGSLEQLVRDCLGDIRATQPSGPYILSGFCFGALIAYEVACRLEQMGESCPLICLVAPAKPRNKSEPSNRVIRHSKAVLRMSPIQAAQRLAQLSRIAWREWVVSRLQRHYASMVSRFGVSVSPRLHWLHSMPIYRNLIDHHRPLPFNGKVLLVVDEDQLPGQIRKWGASCRVEELVVRSDVHHQIIGRQQARKWISWFAGHVNNEITEMDECGEHEPGSGWGGNRR